MSSDGRPPLMPEVEVRASGREGRPPVFFAVSPGKLVLMWLCTFGGYQVYWFYMHWRAVRLHERSTILPAARAVLEPFFAYALFRRIREACARAGLRRGMPAAPLAAIWVLLTLVSWAVPPVGLAGLVLLVRLQLRVRDLHAQLASPPPDNARLSLWNWIALVLGAMLWAMVLLAMTAERGATGRY